MSESTEFAKRFNEKQEKLYQEKLEAWRAENKPTKAKVIDRDAKPKSYGPSTFEGATRRWAGDYYTLPTYFLAEQEYYLAFTPSFGLFLKSGRLGSRQPIFNLVRKSDTRNERGVLIHEKVSQSEFNSILQSKPHYNTLLNAYYGHVASIEGQDGIANTEILQNAYTYELALNEEYDRLKDGYSTVQVKLDYTNAKPIF